MAIVKGTIIKIFDLTLQSPEIYQKETIKTFDIPYIMTIGCKFVIFMCIF